MKQVSYLPAVLHSITNEILYIQSYLWSQKEQSLFFTESIAEFLVTVDLSLISSYIHLFIYLFIIQNLTYDVIYNCENWVLLFFYNGKFKKEIYFKIEICKIDL